MGEESEMVHLLCQNYVNVVCDGMRQLYEKKLWTDFVMKLNGDDTPVHSCIISIFAPNLITNSRDNRCDLSSRNIDRETFCTLLDFVYKGQIKVAREKLKVLKRSADELGLKLLVNAIDQEDQKSTQKRKSECCDVGKKIKVTQVEYVIQGEVQNYIDSNSQMSNSDERSVGDKQPFTCSLCDYENVDVTLFQTHLSDVHQLNYEDSRVLKISYKCGDCDYVGGDESDMSTHRRQTHNKRKAPAAIVNMVKCPKCDFVSNKKGLIGRHLRDVHSPFRCQHDGCLYRGRTEKELKVHLKKQHDDEMLKCELCDKNFEGRFALDNHLKLAHTEPDERHQCQFCEFKTRYMLDLKRHLSDKHDYRQPRIQKRKVYTQADLRPCSHCGVMLKNRPLLVDHLAYHHQVDLDGNSIQPSLKCKLCEFVCFAHFQLHNHVYQNHTEKQFRCEHCDYACRRRRALTAHVLGKHFGQKAFMCDLCGQCFSYDATLRRHLQLHESGTAFTCADCGKIFSQKVYLNSHVKSVHSNNSSRHQCQLCPYAATTKGNLIKHVKRKHKDLNVVPDSKEEIEVSEAEILIQDTVLQEIIIVR